MSSDGSAIFNHPDGSETSLIGTGLVLQVSGTTVIKFTQKVSGSEFQAFLDSRPHDYSLEALGAFIRQRSANAK